MTDTAITTESVVASMLKQRVATSFLDSGGTAQYDAAGNYIGSKDGYGRAFERNQRRDFESEQSSSFDVRRHGPEYTRNVYHFLVENLTFSAELDGQFKAFCETQPDDVSWLVLMEAFVDNLRGEGHEVAGLYGDGDPFTVNTYNHESALSQTLQYIYFTIDNRKTCVLLQVHNGADVRGGYTAPRAFEVNDEGFLKDSDGCVRCDNDACEASWTTDNGGSSWRADGRYEDLDEYTPVEAGEQDDGSTITAGDEANKGFIIYGEGNPTCPVCGTGRLS